MIASPSPKTSPSASPESPPSPVYAGETSVSAMRRRNHRNRRCRRSRPSRPALPSQPSEPPPSKIASPVPPVSPVSVLPDETSGCELASPLLPESPPLPDVALELDCGLDVALPVLPDVAGRCRGGVARVAGDRQCRSPSRLHRPTRRTSPLRRRCRCSRSERTRWHRRASSTRS